MPADVFLVGVVEVKFLQPASRATPIRCPADAVPPAAEIIPLSAPPEIRKHAITGSMWLIGATGAAKATSFVCQLALAWFLTRRDYGIYAIAISLSVLLSIMRDGGLPMVLEQKREHFDRYAGPVFWMMLAMNLTTAGLIVTAAEPAARLYRIPELVPVISLFALTIPLSVLPSILSVRLAVDLRFRELGMIQVASAIARNALLLFFAWAGFGPKSFLLPVLITSITDSLLFWGVTRYAPWRLAPNFALWPALFKEGRWVLLGTFSIALGNNGAYFLLGRFLTSDMVGIYFFAYQLVVQLGVLISDNVYQVLAPTFVRVRDDAARIRAAVPRALTVVVFIGALASFSIAAVYAPLERVLWHGKWAAATRAVEILAIVWPAAAGVSVLRALQMAVGHFRQWGIATLVAALASVSGTVLGARVGGSAAAAALGFGVGAFCGALMSTSIAMPRVGLRVRDAGVAVLRPWFVMGAAALSAMQIGSLFRQDLLDLLVTGLSFALFSYLGLRLLAKEALVLVEQSIKSTLSRASRLGNELS